MTGVDLFEGFLDPPQGQEPPPNPFNRVVGRRAQARDQVLALNFDQAVAADPNLAGEAQRLGIQTGLDPVLVEGKIDQIRQLLRKQNLERSLNAGVDPILHRQLMDPAFARIAYDDLDNLGFLEGITKGWESGALIAERGFLGEKLRRGRATPGELERLKFVNGRLKQLPAASDGIFMASSRLLGQMSRTLPRVIGAGISGGTGAAATVGLLGQAGPQFAIPEELITVPAAFVTGFSVGAVSQLFLVSFEVESGNAFLDMRDQGLDIDRASTAAAVVGGVNALLEVVGVGFATAPIRAGIRKLVSERVAAALVKPTITQATGRAALQAASSVSGEALTEVLQEVSNVLGEFGAGGNPEDIGERLAAIATETVKGMFLLSLPGAGFNFAVTAQKARQAVASQEFFQDLSKGATDSLVGKRNPQALELFLQASAKDTAVEDLYIEPQRFQEALQKAGLSRAQLAAQLPEIDESLTQALQSGGDVVIPTGKYATQIARAAPELDKLLQPHLRVDAEAMSGAEAQFFQAGRGEGMAEEARNLVAGEIDRKDAFEVSAAKVQDRILTQLKETGRFEQRDAIAGALLQRNFVATQAARMGLTPEQFDDQFPLTIVAGGEARRLAPQLKKGEVFEQAAIPEGQQAPAQLFSALGQQIKLQTFKATSAPGLRSVLKGLVKSGKVKQEEIDQTGLNDWLDLQPGKVSKEAVEAFLTANGVKVQTVEFRGERDEQISDLERQMQAINHEIDLSILERQQSFAARPEEFLKEKDKLDQTEAELRGRRAKLNDQITELSQTPAARFGEYVVPGGENYREILLTLPEGFADPAVAPEDVARIAELDQQLDEINETINELGFPVRDESTDDAIAREQRRQAAMTERTTLQDEVRPLAKRTRDPRTGFFPTTEFVSPHFSENKNIVAHIRMDDRVDQAGRRVLFVQEIQSDWAQKGRKKGFEEKQVRVAAFYETETGQRVDIGFGDSDASAIQNAIDAGWTQEQQGRMGVQTAAIHGGRKAVTAVQSDQIRGAWEVRDQEGNFLTNVLTEDIASDANPEGTSEAALIEANRRVEEGEGRRLGDVPRGIPVAPFVTNTKGWLNLALKQVMLEAVNGNYDSVAFITGEQSAAFYDLSKQVDELIWVGEPVTTPSGEVPGGQLFAFKDNEVLDIDVPQFIREDELADFIGKEPAKRLLAADREPRAGKTGTLQKPGEDQDQRSISGEDLRVGGQGMLEFYDKIVVQAASKLAKKFGGKKVGTVNVAQVVPQLSIKELAGGFFMVQTAQGKDLQTFGSSAAAQDFIDERQAKQAAPFAVRGVTPDPGAFEIVQADEDRFTVINSATGDVVEEFETREQAENLVGGIASFELIDTSDNDRLVGAFLSKVKAEDEAVRRNLILANARREAANLAGFNVQPDGDQFVILDEGRPIAFRDNKEDAQAEAERLAEDSALSAGRQPSIQISDQLSQTVKGGLPLFQAGKEEARGGFDPVTLTTILYEKADLSTYLHESAHYYLEVLSQVAARPNAPAGVVSDLETFLDWAGFESLEKWQAVSLEERRKVHETWAFSFELYLFEGKAPSKALEGLFARFRSWLIRTYRQIQGELNALFRQEFGEDLPILTPEIRGVMDRLLASDEAIAQAEAVRSMTPLFQSQEESGLSNEEWDRYSKALDDAHELAVTDLTKASLRQMQWLSGARSRELKKLQAKHAKLRSEVREDEAERVRRMPIYRALEFLRKGEFVTELGEVEPVPGVHRMNTEAVRAALPADATLQDMAGLTTREGLLPDDVAQNFGFSSGQTLINELLTVTPQQELVDQMTDERMLQENAEMLDPAAVEGEIENALHNEARARFLATELKFLTGSTQPLRFVRAAAKKSAREALAKTPIGKLKPRDFSVAEGRAAREAEEASKAGDPKTARKKKLHQLLQNQLAAESLKIVQQIDKSIDRKTGSLKGTFRRTMRSDAKLAKTRNIDFVGAARAILNAWGLAPEETPALVHLSQVNKYAPQRAADLGELVDRATTNARPWKEATVEEFQLMRDAVEALWFLSRRDKVITQEGKRLEVSGVVAEIVGAINAPELKDRRRPLSEKERRGLIHGNWRAWVTRAESWTVMMDGGKATGAVTKWLFRHMREPFDAFHLERGQLTKLFQERMKALRLQDHTAEIPADEINFTFNNKAELIGALKHSGNESNLRKWILGEKLIPLQPDGTPIEFSTTQWWDFVRRQIRDGVLTKQDLGYVQFVWDTYESLVPRLQEAHFEVNGFRFQEIEAVPFEMTFPDGETVQYRGGYVPATADTARVEVQSDPIRSTDPIIDTAEQFREQVKASAGFTFSRVEYNRPLRLSVTMDAQHLDEHLRYLHMAVPARDVLRLLRDRDVSSTIARIDPHVIRDLFMPFLDATVHNKVMKRGTLATKWESVLIHLRKASGAGIMFAKLTTGLQQITGLGQSLIHVKLKFLRSSSVAYLGGGQTERAIDKSRFMKLRLEDFIGQIRDDIDILTEPGWMSDITQWTDRNAFFMQRFFQNPVDVITWNARYEQGLSEKLEEQDAVAAADSAVRLSQGSGTAADISTIERGGPMLRLVLQFTNFWLTQYNAISTRKGTEKAKAIAVTTVFAGLVAGLIVQILKGGWEDEDDDGALWDDVAGWALGEMFSVTLAATIPVIGPALQRPITGEFGGRIGLGGAGIGSLEQGLRGLGTLLAMPFNAATAADFDTLGGTDFKDVMTLVTLITGIPLIQPGRMIGYGIDVLLGDVEPTSDIDYIRGLTTGRASDASRQ